MGRGNGKRTVWGGNRDGKGKRELGTEKDDELTGLIH